MYSTRPRKEKAKEELDIYGNTIDEEIELQGMSRERRAKHNREKLQQKQLMHKQRNYSMSDNEQKLPSIS